MDTTLMGDPTSPTGGVFAYQRVLGLVSRSRQTRMDRRSQRGPPTGNSDRLRAGKGCGPDITPTLAAAQIALTADDVIGRHDLDEA